MVNRDADALVMKGITKIYANGVVALDKVDFSVRVGEIHAVMGENGAGKTTLMKVLFGLEKADSGEIFINGEKTSITSPLSAISQGIGMVHQHFMLVQSLTVAENVVLGMEPKRHGYIMDYAQAEKFVRQACEKYNFRLNPSEKVANLSVGSRQQLEILKALVRGAHTLILDEPTAVLTPQETEELFKELHRFRADGYTIIFISHKLQEIKKNCDRITVMRGGHVMGVHKVSDITEPEISRLMVGRDVVLTLAKQECKPQDVILQVQNLSRKSSSGSTDSLRGVNFSLRRGEILGVAGVEGNGQRELVEIITGLSLPTGGSVHIKAQNISGRSVREIRDMGLSHIPQDRMTLGVAKTASIGDNLLSDRMHLRRYGGRLFVNQRNISDYIKTVIRDFRIKCATYTQNVDSLSGGNIQKVVAARELSLGASLVIADQPTRGVDVGATEFIRNKLVEIRDGGAGILLVSADLNEVIELSDSLIVLCEGEITAYFMSTKDISEEMLGRYMLGLSRQSPEEIGRAVYA